MKYVAAKHKPELLGKDPAQIARIEMIAYQINDLKSAVTMPCYTSGDRTAITANILDKIRPIVKFLGDNKYMVGPEVTYVDFIMFEFCDLM